ncbi:MAG TPA: metalloregulator ArsR/SmtB family transcription factor [Candidatus Paceibacterota bacterium]|nr:metalloregulator ArsR/SmtB family transcription factor [Candidatus Paceibacterota bacterium]
MVELEKTLKALANRRRLAILKYLARVGERSVTEIAREIRLSVRSTSRHLRVLFGAGILEKDQRGLEVFYCPVKKQKPPADHVIASL